ncbi:alpha-amylase [Pontibacillus yanchengensis]|uniref:Alpha-amylase n=2 Tax=Pontibacillus yanchengensis TaxID=462910 RepID=A0A6I4ZVB7_9BACI|nr:alpha-amylase family glycosyl hydrolase [Pontibacillus yanchengensis]MYL32277.1 alpha-amylase [Pontibacillus yanchengensis]MYL52857.1 alpha-amylase [Pontibacillus yanchengensis]
MKKSSVLFALLMIPFLLFYALPTIGAAEKEERNWEDELMYFIMVDRFYNGNLDNDYNVDPKDPKAYHGGDLQGVIDKLDYIKDLGFTSIWLTPIMDNQAKGYHGYWIEDFKSVEENFGTMEDAKKLVEEAHKRDMKVIFDFVVNHTGTEHPWVNEEDKQDWFHEQSPLIGDSQDQLENSWLYGLPDLKQENPEVKQYLFDVAEYWIKETGVDGFRLDTVKHVPKSFWEDFSDHVKSIDSDFYLLGEVYSEDPRYIAEYEKTGIDSFVDYPFFETARQVFQGPGNSVSALSTVWQRNMAFYENPHHLGTFLDNHDNKRFTRLAAENKQNPLTRWKLALTYMYTAPGMPIVYYGTEVPLDGGEDPDNRRDMNFKTGDTELKKHMEQLAAIRKRFPALTHGDFEQVVDEGAFGVFKRTYEDHSVFIAINNDVETKNATLTGVPEGSQLRGLIYDSIARDQGNGEYKIALDRETADIYVTEEDKGLNYLFIGVIFAVMGSFVAFVVVVSRKNKQNQTE